MKRAIVTYSIFVVFSLNFAFTQSVTQVRKIKMKALEVYESYKSGMDRLYQAKDGDNIEDDFIKRFCEDALIYNDILPQNMPQEIAPQEYCKFFENKFKQSPCVHYSNLTLLFPSQTENDEWEIQVKFKRLMEFRTLDFHYPAYGFDYTLTIAMDSKIENAKIKSIRVSNPLGQFIIIQKPTSEYKLEYDNLPIDDWNEDSHNRLFKLQDYEIQRFNISNEHYFKTPKLIQDKKDLHFYDVQTKENDILGVGLNYTPFGFGNKIDNQRFNGISEKNHTLSLSLFYGLQIKHQHSNKSSWFFNMGFDLNRHYFEYSGSDYTEYPAIDADNDPYLRKIQINKLNEKLNSISTSASLSMLYLFPLSRLKQHSFFLSFELGTFAEYTFLSKNTYELNADYHGLYNYYGGVEFDHYYDYGNFSQNSKQTLVKYNDLRYDYGFFGGIGGWMTFDKRNLLKINIGYKHGFNTPLEAKENFVISEDKNTYQSLLFGVRQGARDLFLGVSYVRIITPKK